MLPLYILNKEQFIIHPNYIFEFLSITKYISIYSGKVLNGYNVPSFSVSNTKLSQKSALDRWHSKPDLRNCETNIALVSAACELPWISGAYLSSCVFDVFTQ
jgi:hypothetical protein